MRGNHDDAALACYNKARAGQPFSERFGWVQGMTPQHAELLAELPFTIAIPAYSALIVHAGVVPGVPLEQQSLADLYKMRNLAPASTLAAAPSATASGAALTEAASTASTSGAELGAAGPRWRGVEKPKEGGGEAWAHLWEGDPHPMHLFFGHDAKRRLQQARFATGLDTGAVYGGELTAAVLPPLPEVEANYDAAAGRWRSSGGAVPTLEDLGGKLVSVDALAVHEAPKG